MIQNICAYNEPSLLMKNTVCLLILLIHCTSIAAAPDPAIDALLDGFHSAAANSRYDDYFSRFAEEAYFLGTDATERWSVAEFKTYARASFEAGRGWRYDLVKRHVRQIGDVAWFDEQLDNERLGRCRGTGVVIKENGSWKLAHYSLTLLIPNEIATKVAELSMEQRMSQKR